MNIGSLLSSSVSTPVDAVASGMVVPGGFDALILAQRTAGEGEGAAPALPSVAKVSAEPPVGECFWVATDTVTIGAVEMLATMDRSAALLPQSQVSVTPVAPVTPGTPVEIENVAPAEKDAAPVPAALPGFATRLPLSLRGRLVSGVITARLPVARSAPRNSNDSASESEGEASAPVAPKTTTTDTPVAPMMPQIAAAVGPTTERPAATTPAVPMPAPDKVLVAAAQLPAATSRALPEPTIPAPAIQLPTTDVSVPVVTPEQVAPKQIAVKPAEAAVIIASADPDAKAEPAILKPIISSSAAPLPKPTEVGASAPQPPVASEQIVSGVTPSRLMPIPSPKAAPAPQPSVASNPIPAVVAPSPLMATISPTTALLPKVAEVDVTVLQLPGASDQIAKVLASTPAATPTAPAPLPLVMPDTPAHAPMAHGAGVEFVAFTRSAADKVEVKPEVGGPSTLSAVNSPPVQAMNLSAAIVTASIDALATPSPLAIVDRHLDLARGDAWLDDLARDIAASATHGGRLKFGLAPETLGRLDVEVRQSDAGISVHLAARNETARDMLTVAQPRIVDELRAQGVRVAGTEVSSSTAGFGQDRTGTAPRAPMTPTIETAAASTDASPTPNPESVADGRYA